MMAILNIEKDLWNLFTDETKQKYQSKYKIIFKETTPNGK
jgi:hypothetical protein